MTPCTRISRCTLEHTPYTPLASGSRQFAERFIICAPTMTLLSSYRARALRFPAILTLPRSSSEKAPFPFHGSTTRSNRHGLSSMYPEQPTITTAKGTRFKAQGDLYHSGSDQRRANHARVVTELSAN